MGDTNRKVTKNKNVYDIMILEMIQYAIRHKVKTIFMGSINNKTKERFCSARKRVLSLSVGKFYCWIPAVILFPVSQVAAIWSRTDQLSTTE